MRPGHSCAVRASARLKPLDVHEYVDCAKCHSNAWRLGARFWPVDRRRDQVLAKRQLVRVLAEPMQAQERGRWPPPLIAARDEAQLSQVYADALVEIGMEEGVVETLCADVRLLHQALAENEVRLVGHCCCMFAGSEFFDHKHT